MADIQQETEVSKAFSRQSGEFDEIDEANSIIGWMRNRVRTEVLANIRPSSHILELNCGTGIDSIFFAQHGHRVLATDNAAGMLQQLDKKITALGLEQNITTKKCSFNQLENITGQQFDYVFSNFGGLNCTDKLDKVLEDIDMLLIPGGRFTLVIMPVVCPWEILTAFKGYFKTAFRRFKNNGANAHLEGIQFKCYYYNPSYITRVLKNYRLQTIKGLSIVVPPPFIEGFKEKHSGWFNRLERIENKVWDKAPFNRWADHYMITMQKPNV